MDPQAPLYIYPPQIATSVGYGNIKGDVLAQSAINYTGYVSPGAAGTVLKSNGTGVLPSFQTGSSTFQTFTSGSGTYTPPAGVSYLIVEMVGGGGGGSSTTGTTTGTGGGAGGYLKVRFPVGTYSYAVGAGGAGSGSGNTNGTAGSNTTFSTLIAGGGTAGQFSSVRANGGTNTTTGALAVIYDITGQQSGGGMTTLTPGGNTPIGFTGFVNYGTGIGVASVAQGYGAGGCGIALTNYTIATACNGTSGRIVVEEVY